MKTTHLPGVTFRPWHNPHAISRAINLPDSNHLPWKVSLLWIALFFLLAAFAPALKGQNASTFRVLLEEVPIPDFPGFQAFVIGEAGGKWLVIGGRKDGLHRRQPFASFDLAGQNDNLFVLDPATQRVWSKSLAGLPATLAEQLQSTNMEFHQSGNTLYILGGYGYSPTAGDHTTYANLTAVNISGAIEAVMQNQDLQPFFRQIQDTRVQVTGGYLDQLGDFFYLAGGQKFIGRYNPMGPNHGPGFIQEYTNEIRRFKISDDGNTLALTDYSAWRDTQNLHRRDYNMAPQIFPNGTRGFTMFSGVFQYEQDLPWLNTVNFDGAGYAVNNSFDQHLNQYHTAHLALYEAAKNQMHTIFFGGISRFRVDDVTGYLIDDTNVPFVKTISVVTRLSDGQMIERKIGEMPLLLGASAEFLPGTTAFEDGILQLDQLQGDTIFAGYVLGGIQSSQTNIFFINTGTESVASNHLYKVLLVKNVVPVSQPLINVVQLSAIPNPFRDEIQIAFNLNQHKNLDMQIVDGTGRKALNIPAQDYEPGEHHFPISLKWFPSGTYTVVLKEKGKVVGTTQIIKQ